MKAKPPDGVRSTATGDDRGLPPDPNTISLPKVTTTGLTVTHRDRRGTANRGRRVRRSAGQELRPGAWASSSRQLDGEAHQVPHRGRGLPLVRVAVRQPPPQQFCSAKGRHVRKPGLPRSRPAWKIDINADGSFSEIRETKRDIAHEHPVRAHASQQIHGVKTNAAGCVIANLQCNAAGIRQPSCAHNGDRSAPGIPDCNRSQGGHCYQQKGQSCANT